jgi:hypothetical protein
MEATDEPQNRLIQLLRGRLVLSLGDLTTQMLIIGTNIYGREVDHET